MNGISVMIFWDNASSAGILTEYLNMIAFLQRNVTVK